MKMETPKMDVVRFQEADVLAASSPIESVTVSGVGDRNNTNNILSYGATSLNLQEAGQYHIQFGNGFNNNGKKKTLANLVDDANDTDDSVNSDWNHTYNWNSSTNMFEFFS